MSQEQNLWVVPGKITVEMLYPVPIEAIELLAKVSSNIVVMHVNRFIESNKNGDVANIGSVVDKLSRAYAYINDKNDYLKSEETREMADDLRRLQFDDITYTTDINVLTKYKMQIEALFDSEYASAYTDEKDGALLRDTIERMKDLAISYASRGEDSAVVSCTYNLAEVMDKNKSLFRNPPFKKNSATILRSVLSRKDDFETMLEGINFILDKLHSGENPRKWRLC